MNVTTFDKLVYLDTLKAGGIPEPQARTHAMALDGALRDSVATRMDVGMVRRDIEVEIGTVKHDIDLLKQGIEILKRDLTIRMGGMIMALGGVLIAIKYLG